MKAAKLDHKRIAEDNLVERHVLGKLSPPERRAFEAHLGRCRACLEQVFWTSELREALRLEAARRADSGAADAVRQAHHEPVPVDAPMGPARRPRHRRSES